MHSLEDHSRNLSLEQHDFITKLIPLGVLLQEWTCSKTMFRGKVFSPVGVHAGLLIADICVMSEYGSSPVSKPEYMKKDANNLVLLEAHKGWAGKPVTFNGKSYRTYKTWRDFAVDYSDHIVWSDRFNDVLRTSSLLTQINAFASLRDSTCYTDRVKTIIETLKLSEIMNGNAKERQR